MGDYRYTVEEVTVEEGYMDWEDVFYRFGEQFAAHGHDIAAVMDKANYGTQLAFDLANLLAIAMRGLPPDVQAELGKEALKRQEQRMLRWPQLERNLSDL